MTDRIATIERLLATAEQLPDPHARALAKQLAGALVDLVGDGMRRVLDKATPELQRELADDDLVGNLLVLAGIHPDPPITRAERALATATKALGSAGVALDSVEPMGPGIRVRVIAERGTPVDDARVQSVVEAIVTSRAPDLDGIAIDIGGRRVLPHDFVPLARLAT